MLLARIGHAVSVARNVKALVPAHGVAREFRVFFASLPESRAARRRRIPDVNREFAGGGAQNRTGVEGFAEARSPSGEVYGRPHQSGDQDSSTLRTAVDGGGHSRMCDGCAMDWRLSDASIRPNGRCLLRIPWRLWKVAPGYHGDARSLRCRTSPQPGGRGLRAVSGDGLDPVAQPH